MQYKAWGAVVAISLASASVAQESGNCSDIEPSAPGSLTIMAECIATLQSKLSETLAENSALERQQEAAKAETVQLANEIEAINRLLSQAVISFNRSERAGGACPRGWSLFTPAGGRVIVGAGQHTNDGLSEYPSYADDPDDATGGEERVRLKEPEMPKHRHDFGFWFSDADGDDSTYDQNKSPRFRSGLNTNNRWTAQTTRTPVATAGGDKPHNNMPPYIALYFCKKD